MTKKSSSLRLAALSGAAGADCHRQSPFTTNSENFLFGDKFDKLLENLKKMVAKMNSLMVNPKPKPMKSLTEHSIDLQVVC